MRIDDDGIRKLSRKKNGQERLRELLRWLEKPDPTGTSIGYACDALTTERADIVRVEIVRQLKLELLDCEQWLVLFERELDALGLLKRDTEDTA